MPTYQSPSRQQQAKNPGSIHAGFNFGASSSGAGGANSADPQLERVSYPYLCELSQQPSSTEEGHPPRSPVRLQPERHEVEESSGHDRHAHHLWGGIPEGQVSQGSAETSALSIDAHMLRESTEHGRASSETHSDSESLMSFAPTEAHGARSQHDRGYKQQPLRKRTLKPSPLRSAYHVDVHGNGIELDW